MVGSRLKEMVSAEKGIVYCGSYAGCRALAKQLGCYYYYADAGASDVQLLAQREAGFRTWAGGETPYIVATAVLGTGIDVAGITYVIHLDPPHSIIDYVQETGRAGRRREPVTAEIVGAEGVATAYRGQIAAEVDRAYQTECIFQI
jgi:superfamily II DNA helicase RecQ